MEWASDFRFHVHGFGKRFGGSPQFLAFVDGSTGKWSMCRRETGQRRQAGRHLIPSLLFHIA